MNRARSVFAALLAIGIVGSNAAMAAEPVTEPDTPDDRLGAPQIWGDPEQERATEGWTWFGMGYEQRTRAAGADAVPGGPGGGGVQNQHQSRRR